MSLHRALPLLALALNLLLLGVALAPDRRSARHRVFAWFVGTLAVWNLGVFGLRSTGSPETALLWERFLHLGVIAVPAVFYHYVIVFLDAPRRDATLVGGYTACALFWLASPTAAFLKGVTPTVWGFMPEAGPLYPLFFVFFNTYMILGLGRLVRARRSMASSFMRNRALLVAVGVSVSLLGGILDLARFIFGWDSLYPPGIPANAVLALALGIAVLRYRLMDVRLLAKRLIGYVVTAVVLSPVLLVALLVVHLWTSEGANHPLQAAELVARDGPVLCLAFVLALPLLSRVGHTLDRLMLRRQHGVRDALIALGQELPHLVDRQRLADRLTGALVAQIPAAHASLHDIDETNEDLKVLSHATSDAAPAAPSPRIAADLAAWLALWGRPLVVEETVFHGDAVASLKGTLDDLERQRVTLLLPLILQGRLIAVLCVGEKLSGEIYERDEIELLETLLRGAGVALQNARLYADLHHQMDELRRTQGQLMQSAKLAAIGELAAGIAHEVNNPLMVITGHASLLRRRPELTAIHPMLDTIESQAGRAARMIRGLLDFARRRPRKLEPVDVQDVAERALGLLADRLAGDAIETVMLFDESRPTVLADRDELTQVFLNLVSNAADAMPRGGRVTVSTEVRRHEEATYLSVRVSDTGVGIADEDRERVFESFFTTKPEGKGTGLGLAITLDIVRNHEGTIEIESAPGKGTTMIVNLPLAGDR
jgi:signal transduction histidine kinase